MNLIPPYQHPLLDSNGRLTQPWRSFLDNLVKAVNKLNEAP
ncbi:TetR family transcriptional regulator [Acinetobacter baumannii]|uniref:Uncharacterized protein n=1 Tax=Acinetobacter baumannii 1499986 TaxID=1310673 RepID=A0A836LYJ4_ACIBA|nr:MULTISPECIES: hypothetical protein [Acinetobacter calcoaceticus/baumannii complex]AVZ03946.1 TetR family transcriptional regulator [Acinetobacter pittii]EHU1846324.1 TetR family transcriptional regulator [Acinetobacter baumannii]EHU2133716.1 TetR family transcriptional regulator [Acinetobacter baumannii]EJF1105362.1 TetR family transcriptional regulator [Acinetobacter baumannii]EKT8552779.1 TetR family transcriptional regulator [Acinetobacter baumannii]